MREGVSRTTDPRACVPVRVAGLDVRRIPCTVEDAFLLSLVDGWSSVADLAAALDLTSTEVMWRLQRLEQWGAVQWAGEAPAQSLAGNAVFARAESTREVSGIEARATAQQEVGEEVTGITTVGSSLAASSDAPRAANQQDASALDAVQEMEALFARALATEPCPPSSSMVPSPASIAPRVEPRASEPPMASRPPAPSPSNGPPRAADIVARLRQRSLAPSAGTVSTPPRAPVPSQAPATPTLPPQRAESSRDVAPSRELRTSSAPASTSSAFPRASVGPVPPPSAPPAASVAPPRASMVPPRASLPPQARAVLDQARVLAQAGELARAEQLLSDAASKCPEEPELRKARDEMRQRWCAQIAEQERENAEKAEEKKQWASAAACWKRVADGRPRDAEARYRAARCLLFLKDADMRAAHRLLHDATSIDPKHACAHVVLAHVYVRLGMRRNAQRELELAKRFGAPEGDVHIVEDALWHLGDE